jgi:DNA replication protein DnaC
MGKTVYAAAVTMDSLRLEMVEQTKNVRANRVAFLTAAQLLRSIRETYNGPQETEVGPVNFTESDVIDRYAHSDLLVLDDLTYINVTPWAVDILDDLINTRYEYLRPTIMTSNVADLDELAQVFDSPRIPSRVIESCRVYDFGADTDYRAEAADG